MEEPSKEEIYRARDVTIEMIDQLETRRKNDGKAKIEDIEFDNPSEPLPKVKLIYYNVMEYTHVFSKLIERESISDKKEKEAQSKKGIAVKWDMSINKRWQATFNFPSADDYGSNW